MNRNIDDLVRKERIRYYSEWRKNNRDKIKKYNQKFWLKKVKEREKMGKKKKNLKNLELGGNNYEYR